MSVRYALHYPHDAADEFLNMIFSYGSTYGTSIQLIDVTTSADSKFNSKSGTLPQKFPKFYITGTPQAGNRHRSYPQLNYFTPRTSATYAPAPIPLLMIAFDLYVDMNFNDNIGEWFSFATMTTDPYEGFFDVITVNHNNSGQVNIKFEESQIIGDYLYRFNQIFEESGYSLPKKTWSRVEIFLNYNAYSSVNIIVYVDGNPVNFTTSRVEQERYSLLIPSPPTETVPTSALSTLLSPSKYSLLQQTSGVYGSIITSPYIPVSATGMSQAHFGLYCTETITSGFCYNDNMTVTVP